MKTIINSLLIVTLLLVLGGNISHKCPQRLPGRAPVISFVV